MSATFCYDATMQQTSNNAGRLATVRPDPSGRSVLRFEPGAEQGTRTSAGTVELERYEQLDYDCVVNVGVDESGRRPRVVVDEVMVTRRPGGPPVTARRVQADLAKARRMALGALTWPVDRGGSTPMAAMANVFGGADKSVAAAGGERPRVTASELARCAEAYRAAQANGSPTTTAVAAALRVSQGVARRRVMAARKAGVLEPAGGTTRPQRER